MSAESLENNSAVWGDLRVEVKKPNEDVVVRQMSFERKYCNIAR